MEKKRSGMSLAYVGHLIGILILGMAIGIVIGTANASDLRAIFFGFADGPLGRTPSDAELPGTYANHPFATDAKGIRVAIYNGSARHRLLIGVGGENFKRLATNNYFDYRIHATDPTQAQQELESILLRNVSRGGLTSVVIFDHGSNGSPVISKHALPIHFYEFLAEHGFKGSQPPELFFFGCNIAAQKTGKEFCQNLADDMKWTVYASPTPVDASFPPSTDHWIPFTPTRQ